MEEASGSVGLDGDKVADTDEDHQMETAHLGLNPGKMKEMRIFMFPNEDVNESEDSRDQTSDHMTSLTKRNVVQKTPLSLLDYKPALFMGRPFQAGWGRTYMTPLTKRNAVPKTPLSLLDYNPALFMGRPFQAGWGRTYMTPLTKRNAVPKTPLSLLDYNPALFMGRPFQAGWGRTYMTPLTKRNAVPKTPLSLLDYNPGNDKSSPGWSNKIRTLFRADVTDNYSFNVVDAALFMGRPFQAGWGRTGKAICNSNSRIVLSSVVNNENIAIGKVAWDRKEKVLEELIDSAFEAPLSLHKELDHQEEEVRFGSFSLKLQRVVTDLSDICPSYTGIIEKELEHTGLFTSAKLFWMHQLMKGLFSERQSTEYLNYEASDYEEDMMHLFFLLTGRELNSAVELATCERDVRLACLLCPAGGSTVNHKDILQQLHLWRRNGLDFSFTEEERIKLYELLAALFMGRPFQAGWGRTGKPICNSNSQIVLSSVVNNEKIAIGKVAWDRKEKVLEELIDSAFEAPLSLHKELDHQEEEVRFGSFCLKLQRVVTDLSDVCPSYIGIIEKQSRNNSQKKKGISLDGTSVLCEHSKEITDLFPTLNTPDYFLKPCMNELVEREIEDPGYCSRVPDFTIGRIGYGSIRFLGNTDVRRLDLDQIVKFKRHEVVVYNDESSKPVVGEGLNKAAEVTLIINIRNLTWGKEQVDQIASKLKQSTERQGATFISFDPDKGLWKFLAPHFSRYGLSDDEAEAEDFEESEDKSSGGKSGKRRKNRKRKRNCADPKVEKVRTTVWWDYENASIPYDLPPEELYGRFVKKLGEEGFTGPVKLKTYVPFKNTMQPRVRNDLYKGLSIELKKNLKVKVVYKFNRPANVRRKNQIADTAIINSIRKWLKKGYKPQNAMLVTGDSDFKDVLQELQKAGHRTLVAFRDLSSPEIVSAKVSDNAMLKWDWRQFLSLPLNSISKKARDAAFRQKKADEAAKLEKMRKSVEKKKKKKKTPDILGDLLRSVQVPVPDATRVKSVEKKKKKKKTPDILGDLLRSVQVPVPDATRVKSVEKKKKKKKTPDILDDEQRLRLSQRVRDYGLREVEMSGDGNCQFRAISDQLYGSSEYHMEVRKGIVTQLKENRQWYEGFDVQDYDQYCKTIASPGTWGDHVTLQAAADRFNVRIILLTSIQDTVVREIAPREGEPRTDLWLSFLSELHYNSLYVDDQAPSDH